jgi:hypothetical protein
MSPLSVILRGFLSALLGAVMIFCVLMVSRGFVFDWVTYVFLAFGTLTGLATFLLADYRDMKKPPSEL